MSSVRNPLALFVVAAAGMACEPAVSGAADGVPESRFVVPSAADDARTEDAAGSAASYHRIDVSAGYLRGDIGTVSGLRDAATSMDGFADVGWTSIATTVSSPRRIAMTVFDVMGDIDHADLAPGTRNIYNPDTYPAGDEPYIAVLGCANPDDPHAGFSFDQTADQVEVAVGEDGGVLTYRYTATFTMHDSAGNPTGQTRVAGSFARPQH